MKICAVAEDFYPQIGGMAQHVFELYSAMMAIGHEVTVINLRRSAVDEPIRQLGTLPVVQESVHTLGGLEMPAYWRRLHRLIEGEYARTRFDVIHWHDLFTGPAVRRFTPKDRPLLKVFTNHSSGYLRLRSHTIARTYFRYASAHADVLIGPSEELVQKSQEDFGDYPLYAFIPNGVDERRYTPAQRSAALIAEWGLSAKDRILFCPRRLAPKNGVYYLVKALPEILRRHSNVCLIIAGAGDPLEEEIRIRNELEKDGTLNRVRLLGNVPNPSMPALFSAADLVVIPSLMEAISLSALEAMSCAKHVIASDVGGLSQLLANPEIGTLIPPARSDAIAAAVSEALDQPSRSEEIGRKARQHVLDRYTWSKVAEQTLMAYERGRQRCH